MGDIAVLVGLTPAWFGPPVAVAAAGWFAAVWLVVELTLAEDCWVPLG